MIDELIQSGEYNQALSLLNDMNDENTRYLRLVCLVGLQEYQQAKLEGALAKAKKHIMMLFRCMLQHLKNWVNLKKQLIF